MGLSGKGVVHLERIIKMLNSQRYAEMILSRVVPKMKELHGAVITLQQDNASSHVSDYTNKALRREEGLTVLEWPSRSPDLNPVENVWSLLVRRVYGGGRCFSSETELWEEVKKQIERLTIEDLSPYVNSMKNRLVTLLERGGAYAQ
jgi:transposase